MEAINVAEDAVHGVTDISGVKNADCPCPDGDGISEPCAADMAKKESFSEENGIAGAIEIDEGADKSEPACELETEFEALINGRFRDVYRRRTESIIRKRLRSGKARPDSLSADAKIISEAKVGESTADAKEKSASFAAVEEKPDAVKTPPVSYDAAREINKKRPIENGLAGSCGIVTKINVSALDGDGVLSILRRVGSGEKISFK